MTAALPDPMYLGAVLDHTVRLPVLGVPVDFATNSGSALGSVEASFGPWRALDGASGLVAAQGVRVRLVVHEGTEGSEGRAPMTYRMPDAERVIVQTAGSFGIADVRRLDAVAFVTPALLADRAHFQYGMLEMLTLVLVTARDRLPVHASAVVRGSTALLLAGPSGVGKSTLGYHAARAGLRLLTDDAAYVQLDPEFRLWGMPGPLYLPPESCARFGELAGRAAERLPNGKEKVRVDPPPRWPPVATRVGVCLLERRGGPASLSPASPREVEEFLARGLETAQALYAGRLEPAFTQLSARGGWRLALSDDPREAMPFLRTMLDELEAEG